MVVRLVSLSLVDDCLVGTQRRRTLPGKLLLLAVIYERFLVIFGLLGATDRGLPGLWLLSQLSAIFSVAVRPVSLAFVGDRLIGVQLCRDLAGGLRLLVQLAKRFLVIFDLLSVTDRGLPGLCLLSQPGAIGWVGVRPVSLSFVDGYLVGTRLRRTLAGRFCLPAQVAKRLLVIFGILSVTDRGLVGLGLLSLRLVRPVSLALVGDYLVRDWGLRVRFET